MKILCLTDFAVLPPDRWLWNHLPDAVDQVDFLSARSRDVSRGIGKYVTRYPAFLDLAQRALSLTRKTQYDLIVAWESKTGFPVSFLRRFQGRDQSRLVILAFAAKPPFTTTLGRVSKWLLQDVHVVVPSDWEASWYCSRLGIARDHIQVCYLGAYDIANEAVASSELVTTKPTEPYVFAGGRTERDYKTLVQAVTGLDIRTVINTRRYMIESDLPPGIEINDILPAVRYHAMLKGASIVALPLRQVQHAIGLSVALDSMAAGRPLVCSDLPVLREYVSQGETGILVPAGDVTALRDAIDYLVLNPDVAEAMGQAARRRFEEYYTFDAFARRAHRVMEQVAARA